MKANDLSDFSDACYHLRFKVFVFSDCLLIFYFFSQKPKHLVVCLKADDASGSELFDVNIKENTVKQLC